MGSEYIVYPHENDDLPQPDEIDRILRAMPQFHEIIECRDGTTAYEYRDDQNRDPSNFPYMSIGITDRSVVICSYGYIHLYELLGQLTDHIASESPHQIAHVTRP